MKFYLEFKNLVYSFELKRKVTLISDLSASGKTTLLNLIAELRISPPELFVMECDASDIVIIPDTLENEAESIIAGAVTGSLIIIDEMSQSKLNKISKQINDKHCWFLIINRELPGNVHVSINSVCRIAQADKIHTLVPLFHQGQEQLTPSHVLCEGKGGELEFYSFFSNYSDKVRAAAKWN